MHKPPVAPKPKLPNCESSWLSPSMPRKADLSQPSPGTQRKLKPAIAPKPSPSKFTKQPVPPSLHQTSALETPQTVGRPISQNGLQQEAKPPHRGYLVPICLCNNAPCTCLTNTPTNRKKTERELKALHDGKSEKNKRNVARSHGTPDNSNEKTDGAECQETNTSSTRNHLTHHQSVQETNGLYQNVSTASHYSIPKMTVWPAVPHRKQSDEANAEILKGVPGQVPEEDAAVPKPIPASPRKPTPGLVPRKPREFVQDRQEKLEKEREEPVKVGVSSEGKGTSSLPVSAPYSKSKQPVFLSPRSPAPPAPPFKNKPFLSQLDKVLTSAPHSLPKDMNMEFLNCDDGIYEMDLSALKENKKNLKKGRGDQEEADSKHTHRSPRSASLSQPELSQPVVAVEKTGMSKVPPKKPQRKKNLMTLNQNKESSEKREGREFEHPEKRNSHHLVKERLIKDLPLPPPEKSSSNLLGAELSRHSRSSLSKAKSFSSADVIRAKKLQKANSVRKPFNFSGTALPKQMAGEQIPDSPVNETELSVDDNKDVWQNNPEHHAAQRKFSGPFIQVEQNVDGEEDDLQYEDIPVYEDIDNDGHNTWPSSEYTDPQTIYPVPSSFDDSEGIYEEQDLFVPPEIPSAANLDR